MKLSWQLFILFFAQVAFGANMYKYTGEKNQVQVNRFFSASGGEVIDSIPQLGIFVTAQPISIKSDEFIDLGEPQMLRLFQPEKSKPLPPWGLTAIHAYDAWAISTGAGVVVAVSDTGVDSDHPDLLQNMWKNPGEIPANKIDDDGNGYVDDVFGWDYVKKRGSGIDHHYHGTHVAGIVAARPSVKVTGVAPDAKIMDVSFITSEGSGSEVNGAKTIVYAADNGANIINCSWGGPGKSQVVEDAIAYAQKKGVLVVVAAGNSHMNVDATSYVPSGINLDNIVAVAASASVQGVKANYSNIGAKTIELAAPGSNIVSTAPCGKKPFYRLLSGTSMASPHAAGVAALIWSKHPNMNWQQVKARMMEASAKNKYWEKKTVTEGVIDAYEAVKP